MCRRIVITSGKGGVGKTTLVAHLGSALAAGGLRVLLMDTDIGLNNLDVVCGIENKIVYDIIDVIEGRCRAKQALIQMPQPTLYVMPSAHSYDKSAVCGQNIKMVIERLKDSFDYILIDCPAGIEKGFHRSVAAADEAIVVVTPNISSIRDADKVIQLLKSYELAQIYLAINRVRGDLIVSGVSISVEEVADLLKIPLIGVVPEDDNVSIYAGIGQTLSNGKNTQKAFSLLARNIHKERNDIFDCTEKYRGLFGIIKRGLKRKV